MSFARVGFIGIGDQGGPMAMRLIEGGWPVTLWARRPEAMERYLMAGAQAAADPRELGTLCDFVGLCVYAEADVREVLLGPSGVLAGMAPGGVVAIHSTISPAACADLCVVAAAQGVILIDAPVSGGRAAAKAGALTVMVGGDAEAFARCQPLFESYAAQIFHLGPIGAGQMVKAVNNTLLGANMALAHAAARTARGLGIDRQVFLEVLGVSTGGSRALDLYRRLGGNADYWATATRALRKDTDILAQAEEGRADRLLLETAERLQAYMAEGPPSL